MSKALEKLDKMEKIFLFKSMGLKGNASNAN